QVGRQPTAVRPTKTRIRSESLAGNDDAVRRVDTEDVRGRAVHRRDLRDTGLLGRGRRRSVARRDDAEDVRGAGLAALAAERVVRRALVELHVGVNARAARVLALDGLAAAGAEGDAESEDHSCHDEVLHISLAFPSSAKVPRNDPAPP